MSVAPMRVLLVCANPRGTDPLRTAEEDRTLRESLRLSPNRDSIEVETLNAATIDDLRRALLRKTFDIVHFSGHGTQTGLVFEDETGKLMVPHSNALADLLERRNVKVAVLNACYSLAVGRLSAIGLEYTVASTGSISDPGAIEFTRGFYDALGAGTSVPDAYAEGLSAAQLKGYHVDAVILRKGEEYVPAPSATPATEFRTTSSRTPKTLLGIAIDTSGSMQASIHNKAGQAVSRFSGVQSALSAVGLQVRDELRRHAGGSTDALSVFIYAFGLRIGSGVGDLASLWAAAHQIDLEQEIEIRKQRLEAEGRRKAATYGDLAALARSIGFGGLVDSTIEAARNSARAQVVAEVGNLIMDEADRIGDSTLTAEGLANLFEDTPVSSDVRLLEHVVFGSTPMVDAAAKIRDRFQRMGTTAFDQQTLLVISDGAPTDGDPRDAFDAIRQSGVNIVACFVTDEDIADPRALRGSSLPGWPDGARLMWEIASPLDESSQIAHYLLAHGWSLEPNARLFVQANHSDVLAEFVRIAGSYFSSENGPILPRGQ
jgi:hypothetical protein